MTELKIQRRMLVMRRGKEKELVARRNARVRTDEDQKMEKAKKEKRV